MNPRRKTTSSTVRIDLMPNQLEQIERLGFKVKGCDSSGTVRIDLTTGQLKKLEQKPAKARKSSAKRGKSGSG